ncbi:MAG TPA: AI-2E family transporter [Microlunatus sp.]|nr:AI-2E family transporter [Microlunatus sp.]
MELGKKLRTRLALRRKVGAAAEDADNTADGVAVGERGEGTSRTTQPRRGLFEPEPLPVMVPTEVTITSPGSESDEAVPKALKIAAAWAWRIFLVAGLVYFVGWILGFLSEVVIPVAVAILLAAMLKPVANRLHRWGLGRGPSSAVTLLGGIALISGVLTLIINSIAGQAGELGTQVVDGFNQLLQWLRSLPFGINESWFSLDEWGTRIQQFLVDSQSTIAAYAGDIGTQVGHFLAGVAICLFSLFYFLYDGRGIFSFLLNLMPRAAQARADAAALRGWQSLSAYVRATVLVALVDALGVLIVALILQVPLAPALAALVFLGAFIPLVGAFVSGFVAVLVALVAVGPVQALIMLAGIIAVMQVEGHILQPFLLGRAVHLHPLAVLLAIAIGIVIAGIVGALVAVPILAFVKTAVQELYRQSHEVVPPAPPTPPAAEPIPDTAAA